MVNMKIWFDTEFIENGKTIDLISIGLVREDGAVLYLENSECDRTKACEWVRANVFPGLKGGDTLMTRREIADEIYQFVGVKPEFWGYFADYDWVVLCQLYGRMLNVPPGWPMFCMDVQQLRASLGYPDKIPMVGYEHNALDDALWTKKFWEHLKFIEQERKI